MKTDVVKLAGVLKSGDEITTALGRKFTVAGIHPDKKWPNQWWVEPQGADDYDWWIPLSNVVMVNGIPAPQTSSE